MFTVSPRQFTKHPGKPGGVDFGDRCGLGLLLCCLMSAGEVYGVKVFGPVPSQRLGCSLGINTILAEICF